MTAQLSPTPVQKFFDNNGFPLFNGTLTTYAAGTTTPQATYVDSTQTTQNTNPINLNWRGECNLWLDPTLSYKFVLKDLFGNTIWTVDNIQGGFTPSAIPQSLIPKPTNTWSLGDSTHSWAQLYLGANASPVLDTVTGIIGYFPRTAAEIAAGVTPTNFSYPSHLVCGYVLLERYGGAGDNSIINNTAFTNAVLVAGQLDAPIGLIGGSTGIYKFTTGLTLTGTGQGLGGVGPPVGGVGVTGCRIIGLEGRPVMSFSGLSSTTDCMTLGGSNLPQVELRNLQIQCNGSVSSPNGRDGVVILGSNKPIISNVLIWNSQRDAFVLSPNGTTGQFIEKGQFDIQVRFAGRHGVTMSLLGTLNPYVNECEWRYELRGCSYVTAGGNAIRMTAVGGLGGAAKFSDHRCYSTVWDCIYQTSGATSANQLPQLPDVSPVNIDSGIAQVFAFINPAWENTANGGLPGAGYACHVSGSGSWSGLAGIRTNCNSFWGTGVGGVQIDPAITGVYWDDYSFGKMQVVAPVSAVMSSDGAGAGYSLTGNTTATNQADFKSVRTGANVSAIAQGANLQLGNSTTNTFLALQEQNGSIALWTFSGGAWGQRAVINPSGGIQLGTAGSGTTSLPTLYPVNGGAPSAGLGSNGDYAFRQDTPGVANQRIYVKSGGAWVGIV